MARVAAIQMNSSSNVAANLRCAARLVGQAAASGAAVVALPENFALMPRREGDRRDVAESPGAGRIQEFLAGQAARHRVWLLGGTIPLVTAADHRMTASSLLFDPDGARRARYDKIHLFDVAVGPSEAYRESDHFAAGEAGRANLVCVQTPIGALGLTICYDVRFPELYRRLAGLNATVFAVPSAFTATTGRAHWEVLLRARAIENQAYVVAPAQSGHHDGGRETFGHSMIVDPWGRVLARLTDEPEGVVVADVDEREQAAVRRRFPSLDHRRIESQSAE